MNSMDSYVEEMGLRYFDSVLVLVGTRFTKVDALLVSALVGFGVPVTVARSKADQDVESEEFEAGTAAAETLDGLRAALRENLREIGCPDVPSFVFSSRRKDLGDWSHLVARVGEAVPLSGTYDLVGWCYVSISIL